MAEPVRRRNPALHAVLFALTLLSTFFAGGAYSAASTWGEAVRNGLMHMGALMAILACHEAGHYVMARRNRVDVSLPYFIPFPVSLFGTLGAVIVMRGRIRSRDALMEIGAAGPLAGVAVALPVLLAGLRLSPVEPMQAGGMMEGQSLLYMFLKRVAVGPIPAGHDVVLHPLAWAGWIGLLVTMVNLIPVGQLDGGHIAYALWGKSHARISRLAHAGLVLLGLCTAGRGAWDYLHAASPRADAWMYVLPGSNWLVMGALLLVFGAVSKRGLSHPPTDDEVLSPRHRAIGWTCVLLFALVFMPVPLRPIL
ncbi:MAG: site-2 protease family protein [Deltaproteobacteria bacterium]|nr:site-2 protease family protein [Deltaproteobacteria bacterium]